MYNYMYNEEKEEKKEENNLNISNNISNNINNVKNIHTSIINYIVRIKHILNDKRNDTIIDFSAKLNIIHSPLILSIFKHNNTLYVNEKKVNNYLNDNNLLLYYLYDNITYNNFLYACRIRYFTELDLNLRNNTPFNIIYKSYSTELQSMQFLRNKTNIKKGNITYPLQIINANLNITYKKLTKYLNKTIKLYNNITNIKTHIINIICKYYVKYDILYLNDNNIQPYINLLIQMFNLNDNDLNIISNYIDNNILSLVS